VKTLIKIAFLLLSANCIGQTDVFSPIVKNARKHYFDSLIHIYKGNGADTILIYKQEMPDGYELSKTKNFKVVEYSRYDFFKENKFKKCFITSQPNIEVIRDTSLIISFNLVKVYYKRKFFSKGKVQITRDISWKKLLNLNDYQELSFYMQFVYKYDCNEGKWIFIPEKSYRNYPKAMNM
jgi:hypothetical protein